MDLIFAALCTSLLTASVAAPPGRRVSHIPPASILDGPGTCLDVLLAYGDWMGNPRWAPETAIMDSHAAIHRHFKLDTSAMQLLAATGSHLFQTLQRVIRRAFGLAIEMAPLVQHSMLVLEGLRQLVRLAKFGACVDGPRVVVKEVCTPLHADIRKAGCYGDVRLCGLCGEWAANKPDVVTNAADAVWQVVAAIPESPSPDPEAWAPLLRHPVEYAGEFCEGPAHPHSFLGSGMITLDPSTKQPWPHASITEILWIAKASGVDLSFQVINLGAGDGLCDEGGVSHDPANCMVLDGTWGGLLIEGSPSEVQQLQQMHAGRTDVHIEQAILGVANVTSILRGVGANPDADLLKIDLDLCDDLVLAAALQAPLRPKVIHVEAQLIYPPDVIYRPRPTKSYRYDERPLPMVSSLGAFLLASDYVLHHLEPPNAVLVRPDLAPLFEVTRSGPWTVWRDHYFCRGDLPSLVVPSLFKYGTFDFTAFMNGSRTNREVVDKYVHRVSAGFPDGVMYDFGFTDGDNSGAFYANLR